MEPALVLDAKAYFGALQVCLYTWRRGEEYLYIGCSTQVLIRISQHKIIGRSEPLQQGDTIEIYAFDDLQKAYELKAEWTIQYKPKYSSCLLGPSGGEPGMASCQKCGVEFPQTRAWQKYCSACRGKTSRVTLATEGEIRTAKTMLEYLPESARAELEAALKEAKGGS